MLIVVVPACQPALVNLLAGETGTLAVAPDGNYLAVGATQGVYYYRISDGNLMWSQRTPQAVESLAFSPDGTQLLGRLSPVDFKTTFLFWRTRHGRRLRKWGLKKSLPQMTSLNWSPTGDYILVDRGMNAFILNVVLDELFYLPPELPMTVRTESHDLSFGSAWSADGKLLAFGMYGDGGETDSIEIWDIHQRALVYAIPDERAFLATGIAFNSEQTRLASVSRWGGQFIWDIESGTEYLKMEPYSDVGAGGLVWSADDRWLVSGTEKGIVVIWDARTGEVAHLLRGHTAGIRSLSLRPGYGTLITLSENEIIEWNIETGEQLPTFQRLIVSP
jgi:WD40 repeat protein